MLNKGGINVPQPVESSLSYSQPVMLTQALNQLLPQDPNQRVTLLIAAISAGISLVTAAITFWQLRTSVRQSKHAATFEHLRAGREQLRKIFRINPDMARAEALAFYADPSNTPSDETKEYLQLLDGWDLLGIAYKHRLVNRTIISTSLRNTLRNRNAVSAEFIQELRDKLGVPTIYYGLDHLLTECTRQTWGEWFTQKRRAVHDKFRSGSRNTASPGSRAGTSGGHSVIPNEAAATTTAGTANLVDTPAPSPAALTTEVGQSGPEQVGAPTAEALIAGEQPNAATQLSGSGTMPVPSDRIAIPRIAAPDVDQEP